MSASTSPQIPILAKTLTRVSRLPPNCSIQSPKTPNFRNIHRIPTAVGFNRRPQAPLAAASSSQLSELEVSTAADVVKEFYDGINRRDLAAVERLIGDECVYEDLVFSQPFVGRKATLEFFKKFSESISKNLQFVIDDISSDDSLAVGVTWHLEWKGRPFPFSKGCSFYRLEILDGRKQIIYGRDCVEPATKPGETALVIIRGVTWILENFPQVADRL
ncbi:uncharacterized protein LOC109824480 [Asparagus officinalis]|uniref:uncharacterized protein LOC109824480 n=1 Tax=Asparagus officinalis TaxID=4686 RepID=UPI00098E0A3D|nr:uncharacterized protein LOC109824480 [Asparagus officinalis]